MRLRRLRAKARRLGLWWNALSETERGLVDAALLLSKLGARISRILQKICLKLKDNLRFAALERIRERGLEASRPLVEFFGAANRLLCDQEYLLYCGLRELWWRAIGLVVA